MKKIITLLCIVLFTGCFAYDPPAKSIKIFNNSNFDILICVSYSDSLKLNQIKDIYGKQDLNIIKGKLPVDYFVLSKKQKNLGLLYWKMGEKIDDSIRIYIIKDKTIYENDWEYIIKSQLYERKFTYTIKQLKKTDWNIIYP